MLYIIDETEVNRKVNIWRWKFDMIPSDNNNSESNEKFKHRFERNQIFGYKCAASVDADCGQVTFHLAIMNFAGSESRKW